MGEQKDVVPTAQTVQATEPTCLDTDLLVAMYEGKLPAARADDVLVHVDRCPQCAQLVAELGSRAPPMAQRMGRYEIVGKLGAGGMGLVYRAFDPELQRHVALKLVRPGRASEAARERILREARSLARINHPNVVGVYDVGEHDGEVFIATELVEGQTLAEWQVGRDAAALVAAWIQVCGGLAAAHAEGVIHRDVKPANVFVGKDGRIRIGDFGIAHTGDAPVTDEDRALLASSPPPTATASVIAGTPAYMAPEQAAGKVDARSDQFSACVAIAEALSSTRPTADAAVDVQPAALAAVLARGLRADPEQRYPTIQAFAEALGAAIEPRRATPERSRGRLAIGLGGVALAGLVAAGAWRLDRGASSGDEAPAPESLSPGGTSPQAAKSFSPGGTSPQAAKSFSPGGTSPQAAKSLRRDPRALADRPADLEGCRLPGVSLPATTQVLAAAGYSGRPLDWQIDDSGNDATRIDVAVTTPGPVALVLEAYDPTIWNVRWIETAQIVAVIATGYHRQVIAGIPRSVPVLVSSETGGASPCGSADDDRAHVRAIAERAFGRAPAATYAFGEDVSEVTLGLDARGAKLASSNEITVESYRDRGASLAGRAALADLVTRGLLRPATAGDRPELARALGDLGLGLAATDRVYVVLGKLAFPRGLTGAHAAVFLVPRGTPAPTGDPGHSTVIDLNQARP